MARNRTPLGNSNHAIPIPQVAAAVQFPVGSFGALYERTADGHLCYLSDGGTLVDLMPTGSTADDPTLLDMLLMGG